ncbi:MAG: glycoside hydrolase family 97 protein [Cyclobacteriaceae bacterium]
MCLVIAILVLSCEQNNNYNVTSPNGALIVNISDQLNQLTYNVEFNGKPVIKNSSIGFEFQNISADNQYQIGNVSKRSVNEKWEMPWGEQREVMDVFNEVSLEIKDQSGLTFDLIIRAYDDGIGLRYYFPEQDAAKELIFTNEMTEFNLTGDHKTWWIPGDWDIYEHVYNETKFSEIDAISKRNHPNIASTKIPKNAVNTPVTMKTDEGIYLSFHEADLTNFAGMTLKINAEKQGFVSELVGSDVTGYKAKVALPFATPWRTIQVTDRAGDLIESKLIVNLNDPNELGDVSWFTPMKYVGIWWEMHLDKSTWDYAGSQSAGTANVDISNPTGRHGATTENTKRYIDFAAENGFGGVLVEGWNTGWERWIGFPDREGVFDFVTPYPDYDLPELAEYAKNKGVEIIMHHETSAAPRTYDQQKDTAYALMQSHGIHSVKTGYVGPILPEGEYHHGQWMVNHYQGVLETASKYQVAINAHEPIKATGKRRTYPNAISREGLRGQEFNAWASDGGNPTDHLTVVPFTRMLGGPIDFTPGIFNIKLDPYKPDNQINTTLAHQLALYVVIYSPIQMAADLPEHYEGQPAFQFIKDVAVDWEQTKVLDGEIGDFVVIARQERKSENWFVGGVADENGKSFNLKFDFLPEGNTYECKVYKDGATAHWDDNPTAVSIETSTITATDQITIEMASGGGFAISLTAQ